MARVRISLAVLALVGGLTAFGADRAQAGETPVANETVTLLTGERVLLGPGGVTGVEPVGKQGTETTRVRTMAVGDHRYVVPGEALPYLGRQLDLALFDVRAPATTVSVEWAPGAVPHAVPGLDLSTGRITDPAAFGADLTRTLAGVRAVHNEAATPEPVPHYPLATLTVRGLDAAGVPAFSGGVAVTNDEDVQRYSSLQVFADGEVSFSVPVGHYSIEVSITTFDAGGHYLGDALLIFPELAVDGPQTVLTADARTARTVVPVPSTPDPAGLEQMQATYSRVSAAGTDSTTAYLLAGGSPALSVTPTAPVSIGEVHWYTYFRLGSAAGAATPYLYDLVFPSDGGVPARFTDRVPPGSLATLDATYAAEEGAAPILTYRASFQPWEQFPIRFAGSAVAPLRRTEYVTALPGVSWLGTAIARPDETNGIAQSPLVAYRPGERVPDRYLAAPAVPGINRGTVRAEPCAACREDGGLQLNVQAWTDAGGHAVRMVTGGTTTAGLRSRVYADGTLVAEGTDPVGTIAVPAAAARLRLELETSVSSPWATTATRVATAWSWRTAARDGVQPLLFAEYDAGADLTNAVRAGVPARLTVTLRRQPHDPAPPAGRLALEVSGDDGATWTPVTASAGGAGRFTATVTPAAGYLSLRLHATDPLGGTLDQTVLRALRVD